jgi:hypothetical protein
MAGWSRSQAPRNCATRCAVGDDLPDDATHIVLRAARLILATVALLAFVSRFVKLDRVWAK